MSQITHFPPAPGNFASHIRTVQAISEKDAKPNSKSFFMEHAGNAITFNFDKDGNEVEDPLEIVKSVAVHFLAVGAPNVRSQLSTQGTYGMFRTSDPDLIRALEARQNMPQTDIYTADQIELRTLPHDVAIARMQQKLAAAEKAVLELSQNRLAADINRGQGGLSQATPAQPVQPTPPQPQPQPQNPARR